jgi:hypothetical protein
VQTHRTGAVLLPYQRARELAIHDFSVLIGYFLQISNFSGKMSVIKIYCLNFCEHLNLLSP